MWNDESDESLSITYRRIISSQLTFNPFCQLVSEKGMAHRLRSTYRHMHHIPLVAEALPPTYGVRKNIKPLSIESEPSGTVLGLQCISALCIRKQKTFSKSRKILGPFRSQPPPNYAKPLKMTSLSPGLIQIWAGRLATTWGGDIK